MKKVIPIVITVLVVFLTFLIYKGFDDKKIYDISSNNIITIESDLSVVKFQDIGTISPLNMFYDNNTNKFIIIDNNRKIWVPGEDGYVENGYVIP